MNFTASQSLHPFFKVAVAFSPLRFVTRYRRAAAGLLAAPDLILITFTELADHIGRMNQAGQLPPLIDANHGYGNALNVMRAIVTLAAAGAAGMSIEDT